MPQETAEKKVIEFVVKRKMYVGRRLDKYLSARFQQYSRSFIQRLVKEGAVKVGGQPAKNSYIIKYRDTVTLEIPAVEEEKVRPENIPLNIIYEDDFLMVVNKPPDMVVHPAPGNMSGTL
ncbi:MAG TPA: S4 domain-containing protein, partial [Candidatus Avalokitesvara rifleensis]|uniref:S4 domain-containing protein n=1 Tax=Candidatus Avalokitesvara rifleensis TaxID=3367620 RepID=UPI00402914D7